MGAVKGEQVAVEVIGAPITSDQLKRDQPADGVPEVGVGDVGAPG